MKLVSCMTVLLRPMTISRMFRGFEERMDNTHYGLPLVTDNVLFIGDGPTISF